MKNASVKEVLQPNRLENASLPRPGIKAVRKRKENRWILPLSGFPASIRRPMISMRFGIISNKARIVLPKFRKTAGNGNITFPRTGRRRERSTANGAGSLTGSPILILSFLRFPREAEHLDPQERLFLMHAWMAMEDAGYTRTSPELGRQVGVYA
ncbi:beta-ketoacyl synthase N-terminal-like domain-containing protein [Bacillus velezensis]